MSNSFYGSIDDYRDEGDYEFFDPLPFNPPVSPVRSPANWNVDFRTNQPPPQAIPTSPPTPFLQQSPRQRNVIIQPTVSPYQVYQPVTTNLGAVYQDNYRNGVQPNDPRADTYLYLTLNSGRQ
jgi:hypothetical protein